MAQSSTDFLSNCCVRLAPKLYCGVYSSHCLLYRMSFTSVPSPTWYSGGMERPPARLQKPTASLSTVKPVLVMADWAKSQNGVIGSPLQDRKSSTPQVLALTSLLFPHQTCNAIDVLTTAPTGKLTTSPPPPQQVFCEVIVHPVPAGEGKIVVCEVWQ